MRKIYFFIMAICLLTACAGKEGMDGVGEKVEMRHASLLTMSQGDGYTVATIRNPWDTTKVLHQYVMVQIGKEMPKKMPEGDVVKVPLTHSAVYTSVHCSLMDKLQAFPSVSGLGDAEYIYLEKAKRDMKSGRVKDIGSSMTPDIEKIIDLSPDAVLVSPYENSGSYGKLGKLGIPVIECADYMESSPLGRAEWIRFYGRLFGRAELADSLFAEIETEYEALKALAKKAKKRPTVIADTKIGTTWYVAGANSTMGRMYADAAADYVFKDEKAQGSVPYDPEVVFDRGQKADIWLMKYNQTEEKTLAQLSMEWPNNQRMAAFSNGGVYACNLSKVPFYEETPFSPETLLKELIKVFHPELLPEYELKYFKQMK